MPAPMLAGAAAVGLAAVVAIGWPNSDDYVKDRYQASTAPEGLPGRHEGRARLVQPRRTRTTRASPSSAAAQASSSTSSTATTSPTTSSTSPSTVRTAPTCRSRARRHRRTGTRASPQQCREWVTALNDGDYHYAVIGPDQRTQSRPPVEATWTEVGRRHEGWRTTDDVSVFELDGPLNPGACATAEVRPPGAINPTAAAVSELRRLRSSASSGSRWSRSRWRMGGVRLRRRLLPGWEGAPARLAEAILGRRAAHRPAPAAGRLRHPRARRADPSRPAGRPGRLLRRPWRFPRSIRRVKRHARAPTGPPPAPAIPLPQMVLALARRSLRRRPLGDRPPGRLGAGGCSPSTRSGTTARSRRGSRTPARSGGCTSPIPST